MLYLRKIYVNVFLRECFPLQHKTLKKLLPFQKLKVTYFKTIPLYFSDFKTCFEEGLVLTSLHKTQ